MLAKHLKIIFSSVLLKKRKTAPSLILDWPFRERQLSMFCPGLKSRASRPLEGPRKQSNRDGTLVKSEHNKSPGKRPPREEFAKT